MNGLVTNDANDAHIEQVDEQLERADLTRLGRTPEQALVEILPDNRSFEKLQCFGLPVLVVFDTRVVIVRVCVVVIVLRP